MKVSTRWLARHVDLSGLSAKEIAEGLTLSTAEVEGVERFLPHLSDVVVGHVVKREKHPDADKLSFCTVDVGGPEMLGIVCGAANVAGGQKVAVAKIGTKLPGDFVIKKAKIRGVESQGMICSERELGLGEEHSGIWVLPEDAPVGKPVAESIGFDDWTIEIDNKSLTHRPDLWGHRGIAGEVAAIFRRKLLPLDTSLPATGADRPFPVRVDSPACPRYVALAIDVPEGTAARRAPDWMRALLLAVGQRPIDLLVDLSNFVMLDLGQPNHAFDRAQLSPEGILVRKARAGERMKTLDGVDRALTTDDLLICSGDAPVALAGVMGGEGSKISAGTRSLLLEVATFHPATVRRTAQRLALRTDASARFEKNLDPTAPPRVAAHFARLLASLEPRITLPAPISDAGEWKDPSRTIRLRGERVRKLLGAEIPDAEIADILARLGFGVTGPRVSGGELDVRVPSARATKDITIEQDLVEEVGRVHRYGRIPERAITGVLAPPPHDETNLRRALVRTLQDRLSGAARFHESLGYSFVSDAMVDALALGSQSHVQVVNPLDASAARVRRSVLPSLLATIEENRRRSEDVRLFEIGKGYLPESANARGEPAEVHELALLWATMPPGPARAKGARFDAGTFPRLQAVVEDLFAATDREAPQWKSVSSGEAPSWAHPGRCLRAFAPGASAPIATLGALEPGLARKLGLSNELASDVAACELSIDALLAVPTKPSRYRPLPKFPAVKVDLAVAVPVAVEHAAIAAAIAKAGKDVLSGLELFDLYQGETLGTGKKSLAFHATLLAEGRTLGENDVRKFLERVEKAVAELGGELRRA